MTTRTATCSCGKLSITCEGEPVRISICHCLACQRRTGSTYSAQARWPRASANIEGHSSEYVLTGDEGGRARFHFCPTCGATVYYVNEDMPDAIAVPIGAFADPSFPAPKVSVYELRKHAWVSVPEDAEHYD
ncbi:MAG: GFA family protein [Proteobacteria bacterium]|nr:GFA family protein [Pseudomonadota bacterium]